MSAHQQLTLPWWSDESPAEGAASTPAVVPDMPDRVDRGRSRPGAPKAPGKGQGDEASARQQGLTRDPGPVDNLPVFRHPQAHHEIRLGNALVAFELKRVRRRSIGMVVGVEGLSVRAPRWVGWTEIETALTEKARWICTKLAEQRERERQQAAARIDWREGAVVPVLGESVILVLDARKPGAHLHEDAQALPGVPRKTLHLGLPQSAAPEQIRDVVNAWLQRYALAHFDQRVTHFAAQLGVAVSRLRLSSARTRWGSASVDGSIRLHWRLIHFGPAIVDYVVAHELAHLKEMNHSPRFWGVVRSVLPEYDQAREQLRHAVIPD